MAVEPRLDHLRRDQLHHREDQQREQQGDNAEFDYGLGSMAWAPDSPERGRTGGSALGGVKDRSHTRVGHVQAAARRVSLLPAA